jgi:hypothetical protein
LIVAFGHLRRDAFGAASADERRAEQQSHDELHAPNMTVAVDRFP